MDIGMSTTGVLMVAIGIVVLCYEIIAFVLRKRRALLSVWIQKLGFRAPGAILIIGMILGHCLMYFPPTIDDERVICPKCRETLTLNVNAETGDLTADLIETK
jgi:hypothetical protein